MKEGVRGSSVAVDGITVRGMGTTGQKGRLETTEEGQRRIWREKQNTTVGRFVNRIKLTCGGTGGFAEPLGCWLKSIYMRRKDRREAGDSVVGERSVRVKQKEREREKKKKRT